MASNLVQGDLDTLFTAAAASNTGPYNEIGTDTGEFKVDSLTSDFEKNVASIIALVEFLVANTSDPTSSETTQMEARRQRKMLKDLLLKMSAKIKTAADGSTDDRATISDRVLTKAVAFYNQNNRPDALAS